MDCLIKLVLAESSASKRDGCEQGTAEEWTNLIDRGGLWHVKEATFQVFCALEEGGKAVPFRVVFTSCIHWSQEQLFSKTCCK